MTEIRALIGLVISSVISLFTPICDVMIAICYFTEADTSQPRTSEFVGRDKDGNVLDTDYPYLWSYGVWVQSQE